MKNFIPNLSWVSKFRFQIRHTCEFRHRLHVPLYSAQVILNSTNLPGPKGIRRIQMRVNLSLLVTGQVGISTTAVPKMAQITFKRGYKVITIWALQYLSSSSDSTSIASH